MRKSNRKKHVTRTSYRNFKARFAHEREKKVCVIIVHDCPCSQRRAIKKNTFFSWAMNVSVILTVRDMSVILTVRDDRRALSCMRAPLAPRSGRLH